MKTSERGRELIEGFEGLFLQAYDDATGRVPRPHQQVVGKLTIDGFGHTTEAGPPRVYVGMIIDKAGPRTGKAANIKLAPLTTPRK